LPRPGGSQGGKKKIFLLGARAGRGPYFTFFGGVSVFFSPPPPWLVAGGVEKLPPKARPAPKKPGVPPPPPLNRPPLPECFGRAPARVGVKPKLRTRGGGRGKVVFVVPQEAPFFQKGGPTGWGFCGPPPPPRAPGNFCALFFLVPQGPPAPGVSLFFFWGAAVCGVKNGPSENALNRVSPRGFFPPPGRPKKTPAEVCARAGSEARPPGGAPDKKKILHFPKSPRGGV